MTDSPGQVEEFLNEFFDHGNRFTRAIVEDPHQDSDGLRYVRARIFEFRNGSGLPLILPKVGRDAVWYALAFSDRQVRRLGQELQASVGPSYSDFVPVLAQAKPNDATEQLIDQMTNGRFFRFRTPQQLVQTSVIPALWRLYELWHGQPKREQAVTRPPGRILRDLRLAVAQGNESYATTCMEELQQRRALNATNLEFLRIEALSGLGRFDEILSLPSLPRVLQVRRPVPVSSAILSAFFHVNLENQITLSDALEAYTNRAGPELRQLARTPVNPNDPCSAVVILLEALTSGGANRPFLDALLSTLRPPKAIPYLGELRAEIASLSPPASSRELDSLIREGRYEEAFAAARHKPITAHQVRVQLTAAFETADREMAREALGNLRTLSSSVQEELAASRVAGVQVSFLEDLCTDLPVDWLSWYQSLDSDSSEDSIDRLSRALRDWAPEIDRSAYEPLRQELERSRSKQATNRVSESLPLLLEQIRADPVAVGLRMAILDHLAVESAYTVPVLEAMLSLLDQCLADGVSEGQYLQAMATATGVWEAIESPRRADWLADLLGIVTFNPAPVRSARDSLIAQGFDWLGRHYSALGPTLVSQVMALAEEAGAGAVACLPRDTGEQQSTVHVPSGLRVGIYSLNTGSARAARDVLERAYPTMRVTLNNDHQATEALGAMATNCDYIVATWSSAKHAATRYLKAMREGRGDVLWARGGGASSILRALDAGLDSV